MVIQARLFEAASPSTISVTALPAHLGICIKKTSHVSAGLRKKTFSESTVFFIKFVALPFTALLRDHWQS